MKYLLEVAACGSISAAAKRLYLNQTTLSAAIQAAEQKLGGKLFRRTPKGVVLTPFGETAVPKIREIVRQYDELLEMGSNSLQLPQQVDVCIYACACQFWSLHMTDALRRSDMNTFVTIHEASGNLVLSSVLDGQATIGLGCCAPKDLDTLQTQAKKYDFVLESLYRETPVAYVNETSPLAQKEYLTSKDLACEHLATSTCCLNRFYNGPLAEVISHVSVFSNVETTKQAVRCNNMFCILPPLAVEAQPVDGMKLIPLAETSADTFCAYIVHPRPGEMNLAEQMLVDSVKQWCAENRSEPDPRK